MTEESQKTAPEFLSTSSTLQQGNATLSPQTVSGLGPSPHVDRDIVSKSLLAIEGATSKEYTSSLLEFTSYLHDSRNEITPCATMHLYQWVEKSHPSEYIAFLDNLRSVHNEIERAFSLTEEEDSAMSLEDGILLQESLDVYVLGDQDARSSYLAASKFDNRAKTEAPEIRKQVLELSRTLAEKLIVILGRADLEYPIHASLVIAAYKFVDRPVDWNNSFVLFLYYLHKETKKVVEEIRTTSSEKGPVKADPTSSSAGSPPVESTPPTRRELTKPEHRLPAPGERVPGVTTEGKLRVYRKAEDGLPPLDAQFNVNVTTDAKSEFEQHIRRLSMRKGAEIDRLLQAFNLLAASCRDRAEFEERFRAWMETLENSIS